MRWTSWQRNQQQSMDTLSATLGWTQSGVDLLGGGWEGGTLEALGDLAAQVVRVIDALEEEGVLRHSLDAKRVIHTAHRCAHPQHSHHHPRAVLPAFDSYAVPYFQRSALTGDHQQCCHCRQTSSPCLRRPLVLQVATCKFNCRVLEAASDVIWAAPSCQEALWIIF